MTHLTIKFSNGDIKHVSSQGKVEEIVIKDHHEKAVQKVDNMIGHWRTSTHYTVRIYSLKDNCWVGKCLDEKVDEDLLYDIEGYPLNLPEYGILMTRLDTSWEFNNGRKYEKP